MKSVKEIFEYNTSKEKINILDYGRIIQNMVKQCVDEKDEDKRQSMAEFIIFLMTKGNPRQLTIPEYLEKLWTHLHIISKNKLNVKIPVEINKDYENVKPDNVPYPEKQRDKYKHYGVNIKTMIKKIVDMKEGDKKILAEKNLVGNMKRKYHAWSGGNIDDPRVLEDIMNLSNGKLEISLSKWENSK